MKNKSNIDKAEVLLVLGTALIITVMIMLNNKYDKIKFGDKLTEIKDKQISIECFISNVLAEDGSFGYITEKCYNSNIPDLIDGDSLNECIPVTMKDGNKIETSQKVMVVKGEIEIADINNCDYVELKDKDNNVRLLEREKYKSLEDQLNKEYGEVEYLFKDQYKKLNTVRILNASVCDYTGKNKKINNFNSNIDSFIAYSDDLLQQIYDKCNSNSEREISYSEFDNMRKEIKKLKNNILGYKGLNALLLDIHNLAVEAKEMDTDNKESINNKAEKLYTRFSEYITSIKLS